MGMYTGLRVKVTVKEEYREMIDEIQQGGADWSDFVGQFPFLESYAGLFRAEFIPRGALCYMPSEWEEGEFPHQTATDGFNNTIDLDTGKWAFQCSLKNYESEIEHFFSEVLSVIVESVEHIEYRYEEWEESVMFHFIDGKLIAEEEIL